MLNITPSSWHIHSPLASCNLRHEHGTLQHCAASRLDNILKKRKRYGICFLRVDSSRLFKIGWTANIESQLRYLSRLHKEEFTAYSYVMLPSHLVPGLHEICWQQMYRRDYFHAHPRVYLLAAYMRLNSDAIESRCEALFKKFIALNQYFDFERGLLWILNPINPEPLPFALEQTDLDLSTVPFADVVDAKTVALANLVGGGD